MLYLSAPGVGGLCDRAHAADTNKSGAEGFEPSSIRHAAGAHRDLSNACATARSPPFHDHMIKPWVAEFLANDFDRKSVRSTRSMRTSIAAPAGAT